MAAYLLAYKKYCQQYFSGKNPVQKTYSVGCVSLNEARSDSLSHSFARFG